MLIIIPLKSTCFRWLITSLAILMESSNISRRVSPGRRLRPKAITRISASLSSLYSPARIFASWPQRAPLTQSSKSSACAAAFSLRISISTISSASPDWMSAKATWEPTWPAPTITTLRVLNITETSLWKQGTVPTCAGDSSLIFSMRWKYAGAVFIPLSYFICLLLLRQ